MHGSALGTAGTADPAGGVARASCPWAWAPAHAANPAELTPKSEFLNVNSSFGSAPYAESKLDACACGFFLAVLALFVEHARFLAAGAASFLAADFFSGLTAR